jgi:molybdopterin-biosynthesis enzyme MoeA-like protein
MAEISPRMVTTQQVPENQAPATFETETTTVGMSQNGQPVVITTTLPRLRMAQLPSKAKVFFTPGLWVPLCVVNNNVHILPGIPKLFTAMLTCYLPELARQTPSLPKFYRQAIHTNLPEGDIADALTQIQDQYQSFGIKIGSYPLFGVSQYRVCVTVVGRDHPLIMKVSNEIAKKIEGTIEKLNQSYL